jgi:predicted ATP-dependent protease
MPELNVKELMLREDVIQSVKERKFHIYAIKSVEEGIEILTGVNAGQKTKKGYEPNTVFHLVEKKIKELYAKSRAMRGNNSKNISKKKRR